MEHRTYKWNRFNCITTTTYRWKKYNVITTYSWNQYTTSGYDEDWWDGGSIHLRAGDRLYYADEKPSYVNGQWVYRTSGSWSVPYTIGSFNDLEPGYSSWYAEEPNGTEIRTGLECHTNSLPDFPNVTGSITYGYEERRTIKNNNDRELIGTVTSTNPSAYPNGGTSGGYYYSRNPSGDTYSRGSEIGPVTSTNQSAYPSNGKHTDGYWYVYETVETTYSKGTTNGSVTSDQQNTYPADGRHSDGFWYTANGYDSNYSQGIFVDTVTSTQVDAYPDNGRHTDGFWYVKQP